MENKTGFVAIVIAAVSVLIGLAFYPSISPNIGAMTKTYDSINITMTMPANAATSELPMCGQEVVSITVYNKSANTIVTSNNYTITSSVGADGYLAAKITTTNSQYASLPVNVTCNYKPKGYVNDAAGRGMVVLIMIFMALLIVAAASPNLREWVSDKFR